MFTCVDKVHPFSSSFTCAPRSEIELTRRLTRMTVMGLRVPTRFSGPIGFANGGWLAGMVAQASGFEPAEVTLRRPIPLDVDLSLEDGRLMLDDEMLVEVREGEFTREIPEPVTLAEAADAETRTLVRSSPEYGHCMVCGVDRPDGYRLRPGSIVDRRDTVACLWRPGSLTPALDPADIVPATWAALDCPGVWTIDAPNDPMLLGRMTASIQRPVNLIDDVVVVGRTHAREGRKMFTSTALFTADGTLLAHAEQIWISISNHPGAP